MKRTKIICTVGPASADKQTLQKMIKAGMDIARLNFSHGTYREHAQLICTIRSLAAKSNHTVAIMQDLQGPRIRVGFIEKDGLDLSRKDKVILLHEKLLTDKALRQANEKKYKIIPVQFSKLYLYAKPGSHILINDGLIDIKIHKTYNAFIYGEVVKPGIIFSHKGINIPKANIKTAAVTKKDKVDLLFGLKQGIDFVALSFVNSATDIRKLKQLIPPGKEVEIIAKIETKFGVKNFNSILKAADGIMVARGDLGIELPPNKIPLLQKDMIMRCLQQAKPVIVATQMLESMMLNPRPTRAEVSDVANAVIDHADAVMLSGESAYGKYPVETVKIMNQIIQTTEKSSYDDLPSHFIKIKKYGAAESIAANVFDLVRENNAKAIVIDSLTGYTATMVSHYRPETKIIVLTNNKKTVNKMALIWGAQAYYLPRCKTLDALLKKSVALAIKEKIVKKGDKIIIVTGHPVSKKKGMNLIKVQEI